MSLGWFGRGLSATHGTTLLTTREKKEGFEEESRSKSETMKEMQRKKDMPWEGGDLILRR